ncbi:VOC family protein [Angustibacter luteus]|uniref:VOC family protein n=1 Tax=Angustibacter luteus TaxID=658456 RepID=A0ABW1JKL7_9ACTN
MNDVTLRPVRFTDDVAGTRAYFEQQGLAARVVAVGGGWVDLVAGGGGMLALHDAASSSTEQPSGRTTLSAECQDAEALAERLREAGFDDATVYDEGYGRVLVVTDPDGGLVQVDERQDDLHGYHHLDVSGADPAVSVRVVLDSPDVARYRAFLEALGLAAAVELHEQEPQDVRATAPDGRPRRPAVVRLQLSARPRP